MQGTVANVRQQYYRFPYPKKGLGLPVATATFPLAYELGQYLRTGRYIEHDAQTRILVAGSGAFEPIAVARANPRAQCTAVDLSSRSLKKLRLRAFFAGLSSSIKTVEADLHDDLAPKLGTFDYIVCTGVLHHSPEPWLVLQRLSSLLKPSGLLRIMTYALTSRVWIYELQHFFRDHGLRFDARSKVQPRALARTCRELIASLSPEDPRRIAFENYSDAQNIPGLIDGFFHSYDHPIAIGDLHRFADIAGLKLIGLEPSFAELPPHAKNLNAWQKLQMLDDLRVLKTNPVLWLAPNPESIEARMPLKFHPNPVLSSAPETLEALLEGRVLGCDGALPKELYEKRCLEGAVDAETECELDLPAHDRIQLGSILADLTK